jgi:hypothetical protein
LVIKGFSGSLFSPSIAVTATSGRDGLATTYRHEKGRTILGLSLAKNSAWLAFQYSKKEHGLESVCPLYPPAKLSLGSWRGSSTLNPAFSKTQRAAQLRPLAQAPRNCIVLRPAMGEKFSERTKESRRCRRFSRFRQTSYGVLTQSREAYSFALGRCQPGCF